MKRKFKPVEMYLFFQIYLIFHMLTFGIILILPQQTFAIDIYSSMARIAPEELWGLACILISVFHLLALVFSCGKFILTGIVLNTFMWTSIGTMFLIESIIQGNPNTGIAYLVVGAFSFWLTYRFVISQ